jgi:hypothetical protein
MQVGAILLALTAAIAVATASPARAENVVRWVSATGVISWEPTQNNNPTSTGLAQVYEGLTLTDADLTLHPALATEWALVRPDRWRFHLRPGVHFHDGAVLTAEDVVFSLDRTRGEGSDNAVYLTEITAVTAPTKDTVETRPSGRTCCSRSSSGGCQSSLRRGRSGTGRHSQPARATPPPIPSPTRTAPGRSWSRASSRADALC